jgi:hypothetical protein
MLHHHKRFLENGDASIIWEGHKTGRKIGYCHREKLANLDQLPPFGFKVCCFPVKIEAASAGWTRCVAMVEGVNATPVSRKDSVNSTSCEKCHVEFIGVLVDPHSHERGVVSGITLIK